MADLNFKDSSLAVALVEASSHSVQVVQHGVTAVVNATLVATSHWASVSPDKVEVLLSDLLFHFLVSHDGWVELTQNFLEVLLKLLFQSSVFFSHFLFRVVHLVEIW